MSIQRKAPPPVVKRQKEDLTEKHRRIGELLGMEPVPKHTLAYKEPRLDLETADCFPLVDVLERIAEIIGAPPEPKRKPRARKPKTEKEES